MVLTDSGKNVDNEARWTHLLSGNGSLHYLAKLRKLVKEVSSHVGESVTTRVRQPDDDYNDHDDDRDDDRDHDDDDHDDDHGGDDDDNDDDGGGDDDGNDDSGDGDDDGDDDDDDAFAMPSSGCRRTARKARFGCH